MHHVLCFPKKILLFNLCCDQSNMNRAHLKTKCNKNVWLNYCSQRCHCKQEVSSWHKSVVSPQRACIDINKRSCVSVIYTVMNPCNCHIQCTGNRQKGLLPAPWSCDTLGPTHMGHGTDHKLAGCWQKEVAILVCEHSITDVLEYAALPNEAGKIRW